MGEQVTRLAVRLIFVGRRLVTACVTALCLTVVPSAGAVDLHDGSGLQVVSVKQLDPRLIAVVVKTKALPEPANVYILLPPGYDAQPGRHWPVFYLLHGTSGTASDWTKLGGAEKIIGDRDLITVMPDIALHSGGGGWCSNWPNGAQSWEQFHIGELIPWIDSNLRTIPQRQQRAIAGLSQGGFCSMSYAARHPDLFGTALAYSGAPDIYYDPDVRMGAKLIINATEMGLDRVPPDTFFGDSFTNGINWAAHDPATLAENLRWTRMYLYWGNGQPGPYEKPDPGIFGAAAIEGAVERSNAGFERRLDTLGIPAYFDAYGAGTHIWPYWSRDLEWSIDKIMSDFAQPAPTPSQFTYTSADDTYAVYDWSVAMHRTAREFSTLTPDGCGSFALAGSGAGTVVTPPCLKPGAGYTVQLTGPNAKGSAVVIAGPDQRLTLEVPLGPPNPYQQETAQAAATGTAVYTTRVTIQPVKATATKAKRVKRRRARRRAHR